MLGATCSTTESVKPEGRTWSNEEWFQQGESQVNGKFMYHYINIVVNKSYNSV